MNRVIIVLAASLLFASCKPIEFQDNRVSKPDWYESLFPMKGVNLPHLTGKPKTGSFFSHSDFVSNLSKLELNSFRLPVSMDDFYDETSMNVETIDRGILNLKILIDSLKEISSLQESKRLFLIVDFHQFLLGRSCGGVGIPESFFPNLNNAGPDCLFHGYELFWNNHNQVRSQWIQFAVKFLEKMIPLIEENNDWLTIGIEPMNEPQFGVKGEFIPKEVPKSPFKLLKLFLKLKNLISNEVMNRKINSQLIPFYKDFLKSVEKSPILSPHIQSFLFVFEPFLIDHFGIHVNIGPFKKEYFINGNYRGALALQSVNGKTFHWIAAPHHYDGAFDQAFAHMFPDFLKKMIQFYPNRLFKSDSVIARMRHQQKHMANAGMDMIIGEWGTEMHLRPRRSHKPGGYRKWIKDSHDGINNYSRGSLWWVYNHDYTPDGKSYYLLEKRRDRQVLNCHLTKLVFGKCPD